jgi:hypothetical protein
MRMGDGQHAGSAIAPIERLPRHTLSSGRDSRYSAPMPETRYLCTQCDREEDKCLCDKYCNLCQSQYNVRLCSDGLYYCGDCREACDLRAQN